jgi:hypothetical protein
MIRAVWLAAFGLACIGGLYAGKVTASISPSDGDIADPAMISAGVVPDTLSAADKMDLTGLRPTVEVALAPPTVPIIIHSVKSRTTIRSRGLPRQANTKAKVTAAIAKQRPKFRLSRNEKASKLAGVQTKCAGINSLGALIISLTATSHCS